MAAGVAVSVAAGLAVSVAAGLALAFAVAVAIAPSTCSTSWRQASMFDGVPARERHEICAGNVVRVYGLPQALEMPA